MATIFAGGLRFSIKKYYGVTRIEVDERGARKNLPAIMTGRYVLRLILSKAVIAKKKRMGR